MKADGGGAEPKPAASAESEGALVQAAVERFIEEHSCGEAPELATFVQQFPEAMRPRILAQCGEFLAFDGLLGHQPWAAGEPSESDQRAFGDFDIQEELGRGGMGVVYLARQRSLNRRVALKVMASGLTLSKRHVERFRREAASTAQLKHPAIVPVHSLVEVDGTFAIAMDYIAGRNLGDMLDDLRLANGPEPSSIEGTLGLEPAKGYVAECAIFCAQLASALASAHAQGVMHRDLKPRNLMIDDRRQARLLDFGLSKSLDDGSISMSGEITGTVYYMSPEQTLAKRVAVDHRTDVFALGVILYELLTLRRPFDGKNMQQVVYEICFKEPVPPHRRNPKVPRDLVTICSKALEKDPQNRYQSAADFEADLLRFLRWEPIQARPAGAFVRLSKWLHRHRTEAIAAAVVLALAAAGGGYAWYSAAQQDREAGRLVAAAKTQAAAGDYETAIDSATQALASSRGDAGEIRSLIENYRLHLVAAAKQAEVDIAESARLSLVSNKAIEQDRELAILLALQAVERHDSSASRSAVLHALGTGFRKVSLDGHTRSVLSAHWSPDGRAVVTSGREQDGSSTAILWSADGTRQHTLVGHTGWIVDAAFQPGGDLVATASVDRSVKLWSRATGKLAGIWQHDTAVQSIRFGADGRRALTTGHAAVEGPFQAQVWATEQGQVLASCSAHQQFITAAVLSPCGRFVASAGDPGFARLWSADSGRELAQLGGHQGRIAALAFSPDSERIATASHGGQVQLFATATGELLASAGHSRPVHALAFAPDGEHLLSGSGDTTARLWRIEQNGEQASLHEEHLFTGHRGKLSSVGFDRGGSRVITTGDSVVRVFDAGRDRTSAGTELLRYEVGGLARGAAFDAGGQRILAWTPRRALILDFTDARGVVTLRQPGRVPAAAFDASGERVATAGDDEMLRLWDARSGRQLWSVDLGDPIVALDIDTEGALIAASTTGGRVEVRRLSDGTALFALDAHRAAVGIVRFAASGSRILTAGKDGLAIVWNAKDRSEVRRIECGGALVAADLTVDGETIATLVDGADTAQLWSVADGSLRPAPAPVPGSGTLRQLAFRPDGNALATADADGTLRVTDLQTRAVRSIPTGDPVVHFAWSRDGARLLTSSRGDGNAATARLWHVAAGTELLRFTGHTGTVECNAFSADGSHAITASRDGTTCIWPTDPVGTARRLPLRTMTETERRHYRIDSAPTKNN